MPHARRDTETGPVVVRYGFEDLVRTLHLAPSLHAAIGIPKSGRV